jgi:hypothetical protein
MQADLDAEDTSELDLGLRALLLRDYTVFGPFPDPADGLIVPWATGWARGSSACPSNAPSLP